MPIDVQRLVRGRTEVWVSADVLDALQQLRRSGKEYQRFMQKLRQIAADGFENHQGPGKNVRAEGGGVFRVGFDFSMLRLLGFFEDGHHRAVFISVAAFKKTKQKLGQRERQDLELVARVHADTDYRKVEEQV
jgi:hypothetical protein